MRDPPPKHASPRSRERKEHDHLGTNSGLATFCRFVQPCRATKNLRNEPLRILHIMVYCWKHNQQVLKQSITKPSANRLQIRVLCVWRVLAPRTVLHANPWGSMIGNAGSCDRHGSLEGRGKLRLASNSPNATRWACHLHHFLLMHSLSLCI